MGKILQLLLKQNIIPRCWKFWMNKGFRIWSKSSDFGPGTLRNMSLFWHDLVTEDALMVQTLIMPAAICHRLHLRRSEMTKHLSLSSGSAEVCLFIFQCFSIHQPCFHIGKTRYETLAPFQELYTAEDLYTSSWAVFAFAGPASVLKWHPAREGHNGIQGQGETEILLCHLTKRERSPMSQAELCGGGTSE